MAVFSLGSGTEANSLDSMEKVKSYLYRLTEQLKYTFSNLDPEENFDERAKLIYAANQQKQAELEVSVDGIRASLNDYEKGVEATIQITVDGIIQRYATKEAVAQIQLAVDGIIQNYATKDSVSQIQLAVDGITLDYCTSNNVVSKINLGREGIAINAAQINLNGVVTANNNFKILSDGSMEAVNGKFSGAITVGGANNASGSITVNDANNQTIGTFNSNGIGIYGGSIAIGKDTGASVANFVVDANGHVHCRYLEIDGTTNTGSIGCYALNCVGLNVEGNAHVDYTIDCSTLDAWEVIATVGPWNDSDRRLKKDIDDIDGKQALRFIKALRPTSFRFKKDEERGVGFIAQDVKDAMFEVGIDLPLVRETDKGYLAVNYGGFVAPIVAALQEVLKEREGAK